MHNPLEQFEIKKIIDISIAGIDLSFTNSSLMMCIILIAGITLLFLSARKINATPSRLQSAAELFYNMVSDMVIGTAGTRGKKYIPFVFTLFLFLLLANLLGMIPYSFTVTSHLAVTLGLSTVVFIGVTVIGFIRHGTHFLSFFLPEGTPIIMAPLMIFIELFAYLARPISLSVRLAANMTAGHIILKVLASMIIMSGYLLGVLPFVLLTILSGFEIFIAVLQAYIFTILTCVYLNDALNLH